MTRVSWGLLAPRGVLVCYAIIAGVSDTGGLVLPFMKALGQVLLWNALPNGQRATFYDLWAGHKVRPARFRKHLEEDLGQVFALLADGIHEGQHRRALPPRRSGRGADPRRIPHAQRQSDPVAVNAGPDGDDGDDGDDEVVRRPRFPRMHDLQLSRASACPRRSRGEATGHRVLSRRSWVA